MLCDLDFIKPIVEYSAAQINKCSTIPSSLQIALIEVAFL
jgi:hypothetical protein